MARRVALYDNSTGKPSNSQIIYTPIGKSGGTIDTFYLAILDKYGVIMSLDNTTRISFDVGSSS